MAKKMLIDATHPEETRVVVVDGARVEEFDYESVTKVQIAGNIYLAKVTRVEPSLQAAFVDYGGNRHGFLAFAEIHPDYYQIPKADRDALLAAEREAEAADEEAEEEERSDSRNRGSRRNQRRRNNERNGRRRREGGGRDRGRRGRVALAGLDAPENAIPEETLNAVAAADGPVWNHPDLSALPDLPDADDEDDAGATPDFSDVTEIEIHRAAGPDEPGEVVVERIAIPPSGGADVDEPTETVDPTAEASPLAETTAPDIRAERVGSPVVDRVVGDVDAADADTSEQDAAEAASAHASVDDEDDQKSDVVARSTEVETVEGDADKKADAENDSDGDDDDQNDDGDSDDGAEDGDVEEVGAEDVREEIRPRRARMRDYKIQEVIKKRQILLIQVVKEERGTKGAALTTYLSLAGRYCVLMPNTARGGGISRKITNAADRKRLKAVAQELEVHDGMGLIIRTAGANRTKAEIKRDYEYLLRQWIAIRDLTLESIAPALIYEEGSLIKRAIRDLYSKEIDAVVVEGEDGYREAKDYMKMLMPSHAKNVQLYREAAPLFIRHQVETQMSGMLNPTVQLKSGGYIVIGVTEALVAVDVNSGRSTKEGSIEDTALKTNLEAAEEVARQLKLRDLAGLIVIDFIDMEESRNNRAVERRLKDKLKTDRARIQLGRISAFGLLEMSRQRLRPGLLEATTKCCPMCKGTGVVRSDESLALSILRAIEEEGVRGKAAAVKIAAPVPVANYLLNQKRARISQIEERYNLQAIIEGDSEIGSSEFAIERLKQAAFPVDTVAQRAIRVESGFETEDDDALEEIDDAEVLEATAPSRDGGDGDDADSRSAREESGKRRRRRRKSSGGEAGENDSAEAATVEAEADAERAKTGDDDDDAGDEDKNGRKRRGKRGGRRRRKRGDDAAETSTTDPMPVIDFAETDGDADAEDAPAAEEPVTERVDVSTEAASAERDDDDADALEAPSTATPDPLVASDFAREMDTSEVAARENGAATHEVETVAANDDGPAEPPVDAVEPADAFPSSPSLPPVSETTSAPPEPRKTGWWAFRRKA